MEIICTNDLNALQDLLLVIIVAKRAILVKFASIKKILLIQGCLLLLWSIDQLLVSSLIIPKMGYQKLPKLLVNGNQVEALFDTGSTENFVDDNFVSTHSLKVFPATGNVFTSEILGYCIVDITIKERAYDGIKLIIMKNLCKQIIMGLSFMKEQELYN